MSKVHGMLFSAPMVRAQLLGTKTQTRRLIPNLDGDTEVFVSESRELHKYDLYGTKRIVPPIQAGDYIYVKETFSVPSYYNHLTPKELPIEARREIRYLSTGNQGYLDAPVRPSLFMPRHMARIYQNVVEVGIERLHSISEADAIAEGVELLSNGEYIDYFGNEICFASPIDSYMSLFKKLHGEETVASNPWVFVYKFKRVEALPA